MRIVWLRALVAAALVGALAAPFALAAADALDVHSMPPKIAFADWRKVSAEDEPPEYVMGFASAIETPYPANNFVPLDVFLPQGKPGPFPVAIVLHYWGARDLRAERGMALELASRGVAAVIMTLPYHLQRTPPGHVSGGLAIRPDPPQLVATMTQSVLDVKRTLDWIGTRSEFDSSRVGIVGISLGAIVASLAYAVDGRIHDAAFMLGGADLAHILWNSSIVVPERDELRRLGYTESKLRVALEPIEPLALLPERKGGAAFVIGARHDTVVPPVDTEKLIQALPDAKILLIDTGHYGGIFVQKRLVRLVAQFFETEFAGKSYTPPTSVYAPTIRIGAEANTDLGFQIAVSLDVWRAGKSSEYFAALLASPKGPQIFLGRQLAGGLATGAFFGPKKLSFGAYWSFVL